MSVAFVQVPENMIVLGMKISRALLVLLPAVFLVIAVAHAAHVLEGPAFTDPSEKQRMPGGWEEEPVRRGKADIAVTLDQHLYPLFLRAIQRYAVKEKLKIRVDEGTCGITAGKLARKGVDIGGYCCPPGETDRLPGIVFHTVGIMPIALIVNPGNPIEDIRLEQARELFGGTVYQWSEITDRRGTEGPKIRVEPIGRLHCKLRPGHWRLLLDNEDLFSPSLSEVGTIPDMVSIVAKTPGAIGYEVPYMIERYAKEGPVKALRLDGVAPGASTLESGDYPLYRSLNVTTWEGEGAEVERARKLVQYILEEAERLAGTYGFVPASVLRKAGWKFKGDELVGEP